MNSRRFPFVSDLNMAIGKYPESGPPTEDFFWDDEFRDFITYYSASGSTTLVMNSDPFDFLKVFVFPTSLGVTPQSIVRGWRTMRCGV